MKEKITKGFTLVELLIVMAVIGFLVVGLLMTIDPIFQTNKGNDARRKKDLGRIKVSFEEYYNDKGCYPTGELLESLNDDNSCSTNVFDPWLKNWPCDPNGGSYHIVVANEDCPSWFKILTNLSNRNDDDIPSGWYLLSNYFVGDGTYGVNDVNYGTSSTNVNWYEREISDLCNSAGLCYQRSGTNACQYTRWPSDTCTDPSNCFVDNNCYEFCRVTCCNNGLPCD